MRIPLAIIMTLAVLAAASRVSAQTGQEDHSKEAAERKAAAEERQAIARLAAIEQEFERQRQILEHRLAEANRLREAGLKKNDAKVLEQAEQIERRAFAEYQQRIGQLNQAGPGANPATPWRAKSTQGHHAPTAKPQPQTPNQRSRRGLRRYLPFGR